MNIIETNWEWGEKLSLRTETRYIVLHHAAATVCSARQIDLWHKEKGWAGIGYHYFVRKNGEIYRGRPEWSIGAHVQGMNHCSIGICAEGDFDKELSMDDSQKRSIQNLIDSIKMHYPNAKIVGHREIGSSDCPGKHYPLDYFKKWEQNAEDLTMSQYEELKNRIDEMSANLTNIINDMDSKLEKLANPMIYNYVDENMPVWAREAVQWAMDTGILKGDGDGLNLNDRDLRTITMMWRLWGM